MVPESVAESLGFRSFTAGAHPMRAIATKAQDLSDLFIGS
jgi:hypothetical protein